MLLEPTYYRRHCSSLTGFSTAILVLSKQLLHLVHCLILHRREHVTMHIERDGDIAMSQQFLYHLYGHLHRHQNGCIAMPEIMKTHVPHACLLHQGGEEFIESSCIQK